MKKIFKSNLFLLISIFLLTVSNGCMNKETPPLRFFGLHKSYSTSDESVKFALKNCSSKTYGYWVEAMEFEGDGWRYIGPEDIEGPFLMKAVMIHKLNPNKTKAIHWPPQDDPLHKALVSQKIIPDHFLPPGRFKFVVSYEIYDHLQNEPPKLFSPEFEIK